MTSDPQLRRWYLSLNRRYFAGRLPDDTVLYWEAVPSGYADCSRPDRDAEFVIRINPALRGWPELAKLALIHEMAHCSCYPYMEHGKPFDAEIQRITKFKSYRNLL